MDQSGVQHRSWLPCGMWVLMVFWLLLPPWCMMPGPELLLHLV